MATPETQAAEFQLARTYFAGIIDDLFDRARAAQEADPAANILHVTPADPDASIRLFRAWFRSDQADIQAAAWQMSGQSFDVDRSTLTYSSRLEPNLRDKARALSAASGYTRFPIVYGTEHVYRTARRQDTRLALGAVGLWDTISQQHLVEGSPILKSTGETMTGPLLIYLREDAEQFVPVVSSPDTNDVRAAAVWIQRMRTKEHPKEYAAALKFRRTSYRAGHINSDHAPVVETTDLVWRRASYDMCDDCTERQAAWDAAVLVMADEAQAR